MTRRDKREVAKPDGHALRPVDPLRAGIDPGLLVGSTDEEVLRCFLDLVRRWRGVRPRTAMRLRQADVAVLVSILGTERAEIERRLVAATACTIRTARRCRRLLLASAGVLSIGVTGATVAGASMFANTRSSAAAQPVATQPVATQPVALAVPAVASAVAASSVALAQSKPTISALPAGTEAMLSIPSVGMELPIVAGGQSVIDQGVVTHYVAPGWEPPVAAGAPGTYWLAAHHETHGAPFEALPDVAIGAEIRVTTNSHTFVYTVTTKEVVGLLPGDEAVYGTDPTASVILLQTCVNNTLRVLVHGTLTATL